MRVSSHRLCIETGRWSKPAKIPISDRKCFKCLQIEDEFHFIIECNLYKDQRKKLIPMKYWVRPNMVKFIELINTEDKKVIKNLASYIYNAFEIRNNIITLNY